MSEQKSYSNAAWSANKAAPNASYAQQARPSSIPSSKVPLAGPRPVNSATFASFVDESSSRSDQGTSSKGPRSGHASNTDGWDRLPLVSRTTDVQSAGHPENLISVRNEPDFSFSHNSKYLFHFSLSLYSKVRVFFIAIYSFSR